MCKVKGLARLGVWICERVVPDCQHSLARLSFPEEAFEGQFSECAGGCMNVIIKRRTEKRERRKRRKELNFSQEQREATRQKEKEKKTGNALRQ
jgi:hypothetical protein